MLEKEKIIASVRNMCHHLNLLRAKWQKMYNLNPSMTRRGSKKLLKNINTLRDEITNMITKHGLDKRQFSY